MSDRLIMVSGDSHAGVPKELWPDYLPERHHELLPQLHEDNQVYPTVIWLITSRLMGRAEYREAHHTGGYRGLYDPKVRLAEMDREGVAAELIYHGDFRLGDMFHNITNQRYPLDAWEAGARGWNRWAADTFGFASDRFLVVAAIGPCVDMTETVADLGWASDNDFVGTYAPGYLRHTDTPPLYDRYWDPFWSACREVGLAVVVHAGYGWEQGVPFAEFERIYRGAVETVGTTDLDELLKHPEAIRSEMVGSGKFFADIKPRQPMWQMMLGGVFDRHPGLKLMLTEIRADWLPATLAHLDEVYEANRDDLPAQHPPSHYFRQNCLVGASFIHKAEVEMRHEIGVESLLFGRDYPHPESTWPHTREWLRDAFSGVPEDEVRLMLGENAVRFFDLDRARLAEIAASIGPTVEEITAGSGELDAPLIEHFDMRGGYLKPSEGDERLGEVDAMLDADLVGARTAGDS